MNATATHEDAQRRRDMEHSRWRVSFVEFLLETHRSLTVKDEDWKREEAKLLERLSSAKNHLDQFAQPAESAAAKA